jgi:hypothetical protein
MNAQNANSFHICFCLSVLSSLSVAATHVCSRELVQLHQNVDPALDVFTCLVRLGYHAKLSALRPGVDPLRLVGVPPSHVQVSAMEGIVHDTN